ncbi:DNA-processing protein DprA [Lacisediminihabitans profunda]|uniref:DNA-protecting protein DprA n=1 Tax=Lacisediminihabitans profunda TaxID=2594790 RepID=A0A5C8UMY8_9MICO|nr:DNA-processing protein DprA [Lacisediminihabitans profunda]TXN29782.1 DNA-protecting protein DprA [Lacisediminihabitans profunda]
MTTALMRTVEQGRDARLSRIALALFSEPGETIVGTLIAQYGPTTTARIALGLEEGSSNDADMIAVFRQRVTPRVNDVELERAHQATETIGASVLIPGDPEWPGALSDLGVHQPIALWTRGRAELLAGPLTNRVAIVGSRAATDYGEHVTMEIAAALSERGRTIVSGAAYGIDAIAHRATLAAGGHAVAILAGGVDRFYPAGNDALLQRIAESGLIVSELPPGASPTKWRFLQRNRLVAAVSAVTVVIEAGYRSGSLNTAGHAHGLGRPVGAVPGPVTSAASAGCHRLIREHVAELVTNADEIDQLIITA